MAYRPAIKGRAVTGTPWTTRVVWSLGDNGEVTFPRPLWERVPRGS